MSLDSRVKVLEVKVDTHLLESGEVREAIKELKHSSEELKRSVDTVSSRMWGALVGSVSTLLLVVGFLLKVTLWH